MDVKVKVRVGPLKINTFPDLAIAVMKFQPNPPVIEMGAQDEIVVVFKMRFVFENDEEEIRFKGSVLGVVVGFLMGYGIEVFGYSVEAC